MRFVVTRKDVILVFIGLCLLGTVRISSKGSELKMTAPRFPYKIALTFDDGPHPVFTKKLLKLLSDHGVNATFFVVGKQVEKYPQLVKAIVSEGHEVANHSWSHRRMPTLSGKEIVHELDRTRDLLSQITGRRGNLFRPPGGSWDEKVVRFATRSGYRMVLWTVLPKDHKRPTAQVIRQKILEGAKDGGVVLLHSGVATTMEALPGVIKELRSRGYRFITITEMIQTSQNVSNWLKTSSSSSG